MTQCNESDDHSICAATALALGLGPLALGSDGAGSIRIPAAWTGLFGLKPSFGRVPIYPPSVFMPHSVVGPMAREVESARAMLAAVRSAAAQLERAGATVEEVEPAWPCDPYEPFMVLWRSTYAGFLPNSYAANAIALMDPDLQAIAQRGPSIDMIRYHKALMQRLAVAAASRSLFSKFDLLLGPVMPCGPPELVHDDPEGFEPGDWRWCPFTYLWNMTGQPAASVPWGPGPDGQPIGVQCVGRIGAEPDILRAASALLAHVNKAA